MRGFWEKHDRTARKGRITQAAAVIFATNPNMAQASAVRWAFEIEKLVSERIDTEERGQTRETTQWG
jgi:hypothetical protein